MKVLYVDGDAERSEKVLREFSRSPIPIDTERVTTIRDAQRRLTGRGTDRSTYEIVLTASQLPDGAAPSLIRFIKNKSISMPAVVLTDPQKHEEALTALSEGAIDY